MSQTVNGSNGDDTQGTQQNGSAQAEQPQQQQQQRSNDGFEESTELLAGTAVRLGLTVIGVVLLLFALGQAVGLPFLAMTAEALSTQTGQWLAVAFFAVLLIAAAQKATPMSG